jgi:hypothetical protein
MKILIWCLISALVVSSVSAEDRKKRLITVKTIHEAFIRRVDRRFTIESCSQYEKDSIERVKKLIEPLIAQMSVALNSGSPKKMADMIQKMKDQMPLITIASQEFERSLEISKRIEVKDRMIKDLELKINNMIDSSASLRFHEIEQIKAMDKYRDNLNDFKKLVSP